MSAPDISIITPAFNGLSYLKRCCGSVRDQAGVSVEHIVIDASSTDGTKEWLVQQSHLRWISEPDRGMYDAVNKGIRMAHGRILAYLNCDEQYLEGALNNVITCFDGNRHADLVYGDMLVVRPNGSLAAFRKSYPLRWWAVLAGHLYVPSCALFWRRRITENGLMFNDSFRDTGDAEFVVRVLRSGYACVHLRRYLSAFTLTGQNMSAGINAAKERDRMLAEAPPWVRRLRGPINAWRLGAKLVSGAYVESFPLPYDLFTADPPTARSAFRCDKASFRWPTDAEGQGS
ncbi:MAG: glycosyltransferase family 2 protein [bacterium]